MACWLEKMLHFKKVNDYPCGKQWGLFIQDLQCFPARRSRGEHWGSTDDEQFDVFIIFSSLNFLSAKNDMNLFTKIVNTARKKVRKKQ